MSAIAWFQLRWLIWYASEAAPDQSERSGSR